MVNGAAQARDSRTLTTASADEMAQRCCDRRHLLKAEFARYVW